MTGHVAHMSRLASGPRDAFAEVGKPGARLYYATYTQEWADEFVPMYNRFDVFRPGTPPVTPATSSAIDFELPPDVLELKLAGHPGAREPGRGAWSRRSAQDFFRRAMKAEWFRLGAVKRVVTIERP